MIHTCPHCNVFIELVKVNCGIFRCGIYKHKNGSIIQLPKHASENKINKLRGQIIYGCGNPVRYQNKTLIKTSWDT